jgi:hypothetical protein
MFFTPLTVGDVIALAVVVEASATAGDSARHATGSPWRAEVNRWIILASSA